LKGLTKETQKSDNFKSYELIGLLRIDWKTVAGSL